MNDIHMPNAKDVRDLLTDLVGREVEVRTGADKADTGAPGGAMVGTYVDVNRNLRALVVLDLSAAAFLGTSIALIPAGGAEAALEDGVLPESLGANSAEVLNIMASLFNVDEAPHLRLDRWYAPGALLPPAVAQWVTAWVDRLDLAIDIKGYGPGLLSVVSGFRN